jgi:hypothetical protein
MLKLYLYGYLNRVRSSRRLKAEAARNLELIWLLRGLRPDFKTIADFRRDNRGAFKAVFRAFVILCRKLDLFGRELLAVDGTRLKAVNSRTRNFTKAKLDKYIRSADERLEKYLAQLDDADLGEAPGTTRRSEALAAKIAHVREQRQVSEAMLEQLKASGESQISLTDPDARVMAAHPKVGVGYNAQVAVDAKHKLIVEQHVTNAGSDLGFLAETAGAARIFSASGGSMWSPTWAITWARTLPRASGPASRPMSPAPSGAPRSAMAAFPRSGSATMKGQTAITAPAASSSTHAIAGSRTVIPWCNIRTRVPVADANSRRSAPAETSAASHGGKVRPSSIAWRHASPPGPTSSTSGARRSNTPSVRSSNG